jgi:hypothetical protein
MNPEKHKKIERIVPHDYFESLPNFITINVDDLPPLFSLGCGDHVVFKEQNDAD